MRRSPSDHFQKFFMSWLEYVEAIVDCSSVLFFIFVSVFDGFAVKSYRNLPYHNLRTYLVRV